MQKLPLPTQGEAQGGAEALVEQEGAEVRVMQLPSLQVVSEHKGPPEGGWAFHVSPCSRYLVHLTPNPIITTGKGGAAVGKRCQCRCGLLPASPSPRVWHRAWVFFSPLAGTFAFYRADQSKVTSYPILHTEHPITTNKPIKYPMAGQASEEVQSGLFTICKVAQLPICKQGHPYDRYFTNLAWDSSEQFLYR